MAFSTVIRRAAAPSLFRPSSPALSSAFRRSSAVHLSPLSSLLRSPPPASSAHLSPPPASAVLLSRFSSSLLCSPPPAPAARRSPPLASAVRPTPPSSLLRFSPYSYSLRDIPPARFSGEDGGPPLLSVWHVVPSIIIPHPNAADALDFYTQALDAKVTYNSGPKPPGFFLAYINLYTNFGYCIFSVRDTVHQRSDPLPVIGHGMIEIQCDDSEAAEAAATRLVDCGGKRFEYPGAPSGLHVVRDPYNFVWRFSVFRDY